MRESLAPSNITCQLADSDMYPEVERVAEGNFVRRPWVALPVLRVIAAWDAAKPRNESRSLCFGLPMDPAP
ncbi:MAG TPA: hypothetical protein VFE62_28480 [Gemmataceae bacterium]|nr:hypothetical protein [Gemmataceae bacterium]